MNAPCKKTKFATESDALFYLDKLNKTSKRRVIPQGVYLCESCHCWHLTHWNMNDELFKSKEEILRLKQVIKQRDDAIKVLNKAIIEFITQPTARRKTKKR